MGMFETGIKANYHLLAIYTTTGNEIIMVVASNYCPVISGG